MKKLVIALACVALAFGAISSKKGANDPDSIDLTKYNPQDEPSCWELTQKSNGITITEYIWANEYFVAAGVKGALEMNKNTGVSLSYSWQQVSAANEQACEDKNAD